MKKLIFTILIVFLGLPILAQEEAHLPPAVLAAGGSPGGESPSFSRWRLSMVHVITLPEDFSTEDKGPVLNDSKLDWMVSLYPNPVDEHLNVEFKLPEARDFIIKVSDITGRVLLIQKARTILPGDIIELNISRFSAAFYLLHISTTDQKTRKIYRFQKI